MIEARNLYRIESKLRRGNKTVPVKSIEKDYVLSWILTGIAKSKMYEAVAFKGGTALKKFYFPEYRFSEALDFTLLKELSIDAIYGMLEEAYSLVLKLSNIRLVLKSKEVHENSFTLYTNFSGPLAADLERGEIKIDFTTNEKLTHAPVVKKLLREYDEYHDIPNDITLKVYPIEEVFIEKCLSIVDPSRKEPRDVYDLWYLVTNRCIEPADLSIPIAEKASYKDLKSVDIIQVLNEKESSYKNLWVMRLDKHMIDLPPFEMVYRELKRYLRPLSRELTEQ